MAKTPPDTAAVDRRKVREYIGALPPETRTAVKQLRDAIRTAAPHATDAFSYGIPASGWTIASSSGTPDGRSTPASEAAR